MPTAGQGEKVSHLHCRSRVPTRPPHPGVPARSKKRQPRKPARAAPECVGPRGWGRPGRGQQAGIARAPVLLIHRVLLALFPDTPPRKAGPASSRGERPSRRGLAGGSHPAAKPRRPKPRRGEGGCGLPRPLLLPPGRSARGRGQCPPLGPRVRPTWLCCPGRLWTGVKSLRGSDSPASPEQPRGAFSPGLALPPSQGSPRAPGPPSRFIQSGPHGKGNRGSEDFAVSGVVTTFSRMLTRVLV